MACNLNEPRIDQNQPEGYCFAMRPYLLAVSSALAMLCLALPIQAQRMPLLPQIKVGVLEPGDTLNIRVIKEAERSTYFTYEQGPSMNLTLRLTVANDGTVRNLPLLDKIPAAHLTVTELANSLQSRYDAYFTPPPKGFTGTPTHVSVQFIGRLQKGGLEALMDRLGTPPAVR
jgi:hypothetical protein